MQNLATSKVPYAALNESPSEKEGKSSPVQSMKTSQCSPSMKVPPKRKGNFGLYGSLPYIYSPSMKVPPKRKGNTGLLPKNFSYTPLNESPSEKEGK